MSRTPPVVTRPRTPRCCSWVANSSPNEPSSDGETVVTTRMSPGCVCSIAAWIMRLSPGQHSTVTAEPATRAPCWIGVTEGTDQPDPAHRLVHRRDAELGEPVEVGDRRARRIGDDDVLG